MARSTCFLHSCQDSPRCYKAVTCIGRQEGSNIYVFGPNLHFYENGDEISNADQEYIWVPEILEKLQCPINNMVTLPVLEDSNALHFVLAGLQNILGKNVGRCWVS